MATVTQSYFNLLTDKDGDNIIDVSSKKNPTPWSVDAKKNKNKNKKQQPADDAAQKKQQTKPHPVTMQQAAKLVVAQEHRMMKPMIYHQRPKQKLSFEGVLTQSNQQKEKAVETELLTLKDYEKGLLEKKQALNAVWKQDVERKVSVDKDFESMKLVNKKKDDDDKIKAHVNSKPKKKERQHSKVKVDGKQKIEEDINCLIKPVGSESEKHPVAGNIGRMVKADTTLTFKDVVLFSVVKDKSLGRRS